MLRTGRYWKEEGSRLVCVVAMNYGSTSDAMKLYLDIDGVLIGKESPESRELCLARNAEALLRLAVDAFESFWLTTHSDGTHGPILRHLARYCPPSILELVPRIRPAVFTTLKTEALEDIGSDFVWIDDAPLAVERRWLVERRLLNNWIPVDTRRNPDDLARAIVALQRRLGRKI